MYLWITFGLSLVALGFAAYLAHYVLSQGRGSKKMQEIAGAISEGANAFLKRQYKTIGVLSLVLAAVIYVVYSLVGRSDFAFKTSVAFLFGAFCSGLAGVIGMWIAVRSNLRTAAASEKSSSQALKIALRGGAVSGLVIVSMSLIGVALLYYVFGYGSSPTETPFLLVGYAFGASFVALFAQLGGGIYTKGADVGADLIGKVEKGIPEDDPRNPAVIADLVGDNVGDCAGRGADLFESTAAENIGAMIIGVALFPYFGLNGILFPLVVRAFGLLASMVGVLSVGMKEDGDPMKALSKGFYVTSALGAVFFYFITMNMLGSIWFFYAGLVGILTSIAMLYITIYYTERGFRPVEKIAEASKTGHATNVISGIAVSLECTFVPAVVLAGALMAAYLLGSASGIPFGGIYGTAIATMGMLVICAYVLAMDTFGPIVDNAGGIVEFSKEGRKNLSKISRLDAVGNTTKALTKGYAIGSAALAAFLLFSAYLDEVSLYAGKVLVINLAEIDIFAGALIGGALVFLFSGLAINAVGKTAEKVVEEVRRQFKEIPGLMKGKAKPDYAKCVDICTVSALKGMVLPGVIVVVVTVAIGLILHAAPTGGFLMVATITGILLALFMNTGGAALDNAKKLIESGVHGGKGSFAHAAAVTGDTLGDPLKDTAGPSIHILIKLLGTLTLVLAPLFV